MAAISSDKFAGVDMKTPVCYMLWDTLMTQIEKIKAVSEKVRNNTVVLTEEEQFDLNSRAERVLAEAKLRRYQECPDEDPQKKEFLQDLIKGLRGVCSAYDKMLQSSSVDEFYDVNLKAKPETMDAETVVKQIKKIESILKKNGAGALVLTRHEEIALQSRRMVLLYDVTQRKGKDLGLKEDSSVEKLMDSIEKLGKLQCGKCKKVADKVSKCGRCQIARYCCKGCQKADWQEHRKVCVEKVKKVEPVQRPGPTIDEVD